jgi:putative hemolysin
MKSERVVNPLTPDRSSGAMNVLAGATVLPFLAITFLGQQIGGTESTVASIGAPIANGNTVVLLLMLLLLLAASYVASETAIEVLRPMSRQHKDQLDAQSKVFVDLQDNRARYIAACIFGRQLTHLGLILGSVVLGQGLSSRMVDVFHVQADFTAVLVGSLVIVLPVELLNLIIGQLVPKSYATVQPHKVALRLYPVIRFSAVLFGVFTWMLAFLANLITTHFGAKATFANPNQTEDEIRSLVESAEETGEIERDERELIHSVFEFTDTVAREIMTPRVDLDALPVSADPKEAMELIEKTGRSRLPLFVDTDDHIVGIIHAKDLLMSLARQEDKPLRTLMRQPLFVPENKDLHELLAEMKLNRTQFAVVQDEFGGTAGIVTIEDIVEELVGDIVDEYDNEEPPFVRTEHGWLVDGKVHRDDVNHEIGSDFESDEFDTIGGFVFGLFGRQPSVGECIDSGDYKFEVIKTDGRRIQQLGITRRPSGTELESDVVSDPEDSH